MKTTSRNFVFLTLILTSLTFLQIPQLAPKALAQSSQREMNETALVVSSEANSKSKAILKADLTSKNSKENNNIGVIAADSTATKEALSSAVQFSATAYCLSGRTATGSGVRRGIIAADPRVLPLGTRVQLTAGAWSGTYTVADTGGRIRGKKIDVWVPNSSEARRFGRRTVHVTVLGKK